MRVLVVRSFVMLVKCIQYNATIVKSLFLLVISVRVLFVVQDKLCIFATLSWQFMLFPCILVICFILWCPVQFLYQNNTCRRAHMSCLCYCLKWYPIDLTIWVAWRVSYKSKKMPTLRERISSFPGFYWDPSCSSF